MANKKDPRKRSVYIPVDLLKELYYESVRLDRTVSWIIQQCIRRALPEIKKMPSINEVPPDFEVRVDTASGASAPTRSEEDERAR